MLTLTLTGCLTPAGGATWVLPCDGRSDYDACSVAQVCPNPNPDPNLTLTLTVTLILNLTLTLAPEPSP